MNGLRHVDSALERAAGQGLQYAQFLPDEDENLMTLVLTDGETIEQHVTLRAGERFGLSRQEGANGDRENHHLQRGESGAGAVART